MYIISPLHRQEDLWNTIQNFYRQEMEGLILLIILDWDSKIKIPYRLFGSPESDHIKVLYTKQKDPASGRNAGLEYIRQVHDTPQKWLAFDSDDYYGPRYAASRLKALDECHYLGQEKIFILMPSGALMECNTPIPMGSTLGGYSDCVDFQVGKNEDGVWFKVMRDLGKVYSGHDHYGHLYIRHEDNTWKVSEDDLLREMMMRSLEPTFECLDYVSPRDVVEDPLQRGWTRKRVPISAIFKGL